MEQEIGFCVAKDGVRIAYATLGEGPPLVYACGWPVHLQLEWEKPTSRRFLQELAQGSRLVRYDMRGTGLSDRDLRVFDSELLVGDLEAVVDHLRLERFALLSLGDMAGPTCLAYAAKHGDRVSHLVLNSAFVSGRELVALERQQPMIEYTAAFGFPIFEFTDAPDLTAEQQRELRDIEGAAATPLVQAAVLKAIFEADVSALLDRVTAPTLVLHARDDPWIPFSQGRELAARLPCARFVPFESSSASPLAYSRRLIREIHRFLGPAPAEAEEQAGYGILTPREVEVLSRIAAGMTSTQVAGDLVVSVRTVERHISNIYLKLDIHTRAEAAAYALRYGLIRLP